MTKTYIMDASVVVALYKKNDPQHERVYEWFEAISGEDVHMAPSLLLVEMSAVLSQCNLSKSVSDRAIASAKATFELSDLTTSRSVHAGDLAYETGSRGADAVYIQAALERSGTLVTSDRRQSQAANRAGVETILLCGPE